MLLSLLFVTWMSGGGVADSRAVVPRGGVARPEARLTLCAAATCLLKESFAARPRPDTTAHGPIHSTSRFCSPPGHTARMRLPAAVLNGIVCFGARV
ncbi:hypothetical protein JKP88DRAFT_222888 [Tribonema minus]|uniref:Secreted protein n=1 Tax=Tribonema minus TaxID=303371 RepID=A0A835YTP1_9STRA|nr:hypothetical protein JKP88DRAFT_222888 [Tribonema minus]